MKKKIIIPIIVVLAAAVIGTGCFFAVKNGKKPDTPETPKTVGLPYSPDDKLYIESSVPFTGMNPDNGGKTGEYIAGLNMKNLSGEHLVWADVTVKLQDGETLTFRAEEVPSGQSVCAFETGNKRWKTDVSIEKIEINAEYTSKSVMSEQLLDVKTDYVDITVKNISKNTVDKVIVSYHPMVNGVYYGGKVYTQEITSLAAGEETALKALECFLDGAAVTAVRAS